ncbi:hypothetical protein MMC09_002451 [Bachmanniomyces sp. S44760]|nr:hypothetical protein [Bachmanniomyces sp. S44760]
MPAKNNVFGSYQQALENELENIGLNKRYISGAEIQSLSGKTSLIVTERPRVQRFPNRGPNQPSSPNPPLHEFESDQEMPQPMPPPDAFHHGTPFIEDVVMSNYWQMLWEKHTRVVVMLAGQPWDIDHALKGDYPQNSIGSTPYYLPLAMNKPARYGKFTVRVVSERFDKASRATVRSLKIQKSSKDEQRSLTHIFIPVVAFGQNRDQDEGSVELPSDKQMIALLKLVQAENKKTDNNGMKSGPVAVHCEQGHGRTGVFMMAMFLLEDKENGAIQERISQDKTFDYIVTSINQARMKRSGIIKFKVQFKYLYYVRRLI